MVNRRLHLVVAAVLLVSALAFGAKQVASRNAVKGQAQEVKGAHSDSLSGATSTASGGAANDHVVPANSVWIARPDGAVSCSTKTGQSLEEGAEDLKQAKVRVLESRKGNDGKLHMQMCDAPSGSTNAYLIPKDDLAAAVAQGFVQAK